MKKNYQQPSMRIIELKVSQHLLSGSYGGNTGYIDSPMTSDVMEA